MKNINHKIYSAVAIIMLGGMWAACSDPDMLDPVINTDPSNIKTDFLFINASPDAPSLDLYINNEKVGESLESGESWSSYQNVDITAAGVFANTNIRAKATSGKIGGVLNGSDLIYRAGNNNSNNFQASANTKYTLIVVDSINRAKPVRTLNASNIGDITYYSPVKTFTAPSKLDGSDTTINLTENNSVVTVNLVKKYNGGVQPSFFTPIGIVPLGSSDAGGVRFYLLQDFAPTPVDDKAGFRFLPLSPNAPTLHARLVPGVGSPIVLTGTGAAYAFGTGAFNPSVGSRTVIPTSANFTLNTIASSGTPIDYTLEVSTKADFSNSIISMPVSFTPKKNYTIYVSGFFGEDLTAQIVQH